VRSSVAMNPPISALRSSRITDQPARANSAVDATSDDDRIGLVRHLADSSQGEYMGTALQNIWHAGHADSDSIGGRWKFSWRPYYPSRHLPPAKLRAFLDIVLASITPPTSRLKETGNASRKVR
jgi:hypothetical protein